MYGKCEPAVMYKFMMLNLILIVGTPFLLVFGILDIYRGLQPLGYIITASGFLCAATFTFLRKTKNFIFGSYFLVFVLFWTFLYLLATGGSGNSGILWYYSFPLISLFLLGARKGSLIVFTSLLFAAVILFWPGTPFLKTTYVSEIKIRFIPSVLVLWIITSLFEYVMSAALKIEIQNTELREAVDELSKARKALISEKERLAVTLRSIGEGVIAADMNGLVVLMNTVAEKLTGWTQGEAAGRFVGDIVHVNDRASGKSCDISLTEVFEKKTIVAAMELRVLVNRKGIERIISDSGAPIFDRDGQVVGAVLVFRDVTDQVRMEEDLYRTGKLESVGLLAGGIAHDFNNILSGILGNAELAKITGSRGEDAGPFLERILKATRRATALTNQLLTFAKGGEPIIKSITLSNLLRENVEFALSGSPIKGDISISDTLWAVYADPGQIGQVISNLLINAAQASSEGDSIRVTAANITAFEGEIAGLAPGRYVAITIQDHGSGISPENMAKIFDPYFTTKDYGTGLGLTISYSIIRKHNGLIKLESRLGEGTTFNVYLPASFEEVETDAPRAMISAASCKGKILVVDDEEDLRIILFTLLEGCGYVVLPVADGEEALSAYKAAMAASEPFDLVITDLTIPGGMGGKELVERLLEIDSKAKVIVASGYSHDPIMAQFGRHGLKGVIEKPFEFSTITDMIARVIAGD